MAFAREVGGAGLMSSGEDVGEGFSFGREGAPGDGIIGEIFWQIMADLVD